MLRLFRRRRTTAARPTAQAADVSAAAARSVSGPARAQAAAPYLPPHIVTREIAKYLRPTDAIRLAAAHKSFRNAKLGADADVARLAKAVDNSMSRVISELAAALYTFLAKIRQAERRAGGGLRFEVDEANLLVAATSYPELTITRQVNDWKITVDVMQGSTQDALWVGIEVRRGNAWTTADVRFDRQADVLRIGYVDTDLSQVKSKTLNSPKAVLKRVLALYRQKPFVVVGR